MKLLSSFPTTLVALSVVFIGTTVVDFGKVDAAKTCKNLFQCMPFMFNIPFKDIVNATYYYTGSLMKLSEISDADWNKQMNTLLSLCDIWTSFNDCMDPNWIECMDWGQLSALIELVSVTTVDRQTNTNSTAAAAKRQQGLNKTQQGLSSIGWTAKDTEKSMKIGSFLCKNARNLVPYMSCMRDMLLSNETLINITLWYNGLIFNKCVQADISCAKTEKMTKMMGHWLYHGCQQGTEQLTEVVRAIFQGMMFTDDSECVNIFQGKTARDLFEPAYDRRTERDFGNDISHCNLTAVEAEKNAIYNRSVRKYFTDANVTREEFYHRMACKHKNMSLADCNIWPITSTTRRPTTTRIRTTTTPSTTTAATEAPVPQVTDQVTEPPPTQPPVKQPPIRQGSRQEQNALALVSGAPAEQTTKRSGTKKPSTRAPKKIEQSYDDNGASSSRLETRFFCAFLVTITILAAQLI